jgi:GPH family glycoside/pentoside/hexuronide:cation symporter
MSIFGKKNAADGVAAEDRVPYWQKMAYGLAGPVDILSVWILVSLAYQVFNMELGLAPTKVAIILMMLRLWDGVADPVMGWISDNTRTRWGRRRPYILIGGILTGLTFPLLWWFPESYGLPENHNHMMTWVIGFGVIFYTAFTIWAMPYQSLLMEMTPDYNERTRVTSVRSILQSLASFFVGCSWWVALRFHGADGLPSAATGMRIISLYIGGAILVMAPLPAFFVKERYYDHITRDLPYTNVRKFLKELVLKNPIVAGVIALLFGLLIWKFQAVLDILSEHPFYTLPFFFLLLGLRNVREALKNHPFRVLSVFTVLFLVGTSIFDSYGRYVGVYYVLGGDKDLSAVYQILGTTAYMLSSLIMIPVFRRISEHIGKPKTLLISVVLVLVSAFLTWFTFNPAYPVLTLVNTFFIGAGYAGLWLMIPSMQIDVVDDDELKSGERREGTFAAVFSWILKISFCFGFLVSGPLIEKAGFNWALTNQAGWFSDWTKTVPNQQTNSVADIGYIVVREASLPPLSTNTPFASLQIAYAALPDIAGNATDDQVKAAFAAAKESLGAPKIAEVGLGTDTNDCLQPLTGFKNLAGLPESDSLPGQRVGYVALADQLPGGKEVAEDGSLFKKFIRRISRSRVRGPADIDGWVAYSFIPEGQAVAGKEWLKNAALARVYFAQPMPGAADPFAARLDANQPPSVYLNMRIWYVGLPAIALIIALLLLHFFPITPKRAAEIREQLEARRGKV